jgi:hypothetical protein
LHRRHLVLCDRLNLLRRKDDAAHDSHVLSVPLILEMILPRDAGNGVGGGKYSGADPMAHTASFDLAPGIRIP